MQRNDSGNLIFQRAVAFVNQTSQHIFLTGKAGTGKTTFLRYIREHCYKKMAVVAPTGVAAINAGGVTIHSFFQLPFGTFLPTARTVWGGDNQNIYNQNQLLAKLRLSREKRTLIRELDLLIIDEISMVRADVMDAIDTVLRWIRNSNEVFGGVQLVFIGDMFQLPPVVRNQEWDLMAEHYSSPFFFDALSVKRAQPLYIELKKIYRQRDAAFISVLNNIRNNTCSFEDIELLQRYYRPHFDVPHDQGYITLTSHNYKADAINQQELEKLPAPLFRIEANVIDDFPEHAYPVDRVMYLREGAQVMFIKNDKGEKRRYYNGKIGRIERIEKNGAEIWVSFPGENDQLQVERETWKNIKYHYDNDDDEIKEEELGSFQQFPLRLAWAVTIHKSQGLTFDKAIVDAGQSFAAGQVYVALSRLTSLDGLVLRSRIDPDRIMTDERILDFSKNEVPEDELDRILEDAQKIFTEQSLLQAYNWDDVAEAWKEHTESLNIRSLPDPLEVRVFSDKILQALLQEQQTAQKFKKHLERFFQIAAAATEIHERTSAAVNWFRDHLDNEVISPLKAHIEAEKIKPRTKKYVKDLRQILQSIERKRIHLQQTESITAALASRQSMQDIMEKVSLLHVPLSIPAEKEEEKKKAVPGESKRISLEMFRSGKSASEIAQLRQMANSTIEGHLADFVGTGEIDINQLVQPDKQLLILKELEQMPEPLSSSIKEKLGAAVSYADIKAVTKHWQRNREQAGSKV
jgi:hypothetical protein